MLRLASILASLLFILSCGSFFPGDTFSRSNDDGIPLNNGDFPEKAVFSLKSGSFESGKAIPNQFSNKISPQCSGNNDFPALSWSNPPKGTQSFVLIVEDPDGGNWVHLNLYDIPGSTTDISEVRATNGVVAFPSGKVGTNSWSESGWGGPCPPSGSGEHKYVFKLYALNVASLEDPLDNTNQKSFEESFEAVHSTNILASVQISGFFKEPEL